MFVNWTFEMVWKFAYLVNHWSKTETKIENNTSQGPIHFSDIFFLIRRNLSIFECKKKISSVFFFHCNLYVEFICDIKRTQKLFRQDPMIAFSHIPLTHYSSLNHHPSVLH